MKMQISSKPLINLARKRYVLIVFLFLLVYLLSLFGTALSSDNNQVLPVHFNRSNIDLSNQAINLANPSFEDGGSNITGWQSEIWSGDAIFTIVSNVSRTGSNSALATSVSGTSAALVTSSSIKLRVVGGETYTASVWVVTNDTANESGAVVALAWYDTSGSHINSVANDLLTNASDWTHIFVNAVAPQNAETCKIELHLIGKGSVYFDDAGFSYLPKIDNAQNGKSQGNVTLNGIANAHIITNTTSLNLQGDFTSPQNEQLTYVFPVNISTEKYTLLSFKFITSTSNNSGLLITFDYSDGAKIVTYGTAISNQLNAVTIDPRKTPSYLYYLGNRPVVPGKQLSAIEFTLDDWPDSADSGTYNVQVSDLVFYGASTQDIILILESSAFLLSATLLFTIYSNDHHRVLGKVLIGLGTSIAFVAASSRLLIPIPISIGWGMTAGSITEILGIGIALTGIILMILGNSPKLVPPKNNNININETKKSTNSLATEEGVTEGDLQSTRLDQVSTVPHRGQVKLIIFIFGLFLIPAIGFLLRLNNALVLPLFDDEVSRYITAWGLLHGQSMGLNLAGPWDPTTVDMLKTGIYSVSQWPSGLPIPYASTVYYPTFYTVSPFLEPFMTHIIVAPFMGIFGFNAITLRLPFIFMSLTTNIVVFLIASRRSNLMAGLIASVFFAVTPYLVHYGSQAFEDNAVMLFYTLAFYSFLRFKDSGYKGKWVYVSAVLAALSCLSKIGAFFAPIFFIAVLFLSRQVLRRQIVKSVTLLVGVILIYPIIGFIVSPKAFVTSLLGFAQYNQVAKDVALSGAQPVLNQMALIGSVMFGFICVVYLLFNRHKERLEIGVGVVSYLLILLLIFTFAKEHYFIAIMPFLAVAAGLTFASLIKHPKPLPLITILTVFVFTLQSGIFQIALFLGAVALAAIAFRHKTPKINNALSIYSAILLLIIFSTLIIYGWQYTFLY